MTVITLLPAASRTGEFVTSSFVIASVPPGAASIRTNMLESDLHGAGHSGYIQIELSDDGIVWEFFAGMAWESNNNLRNGLPIGNPSIGVNDLSVFVGKRIRGRCRFEGVTCAIELVMPS